MKRPYDHAVLIVGCLVMVAPLAMVFLGAGSTSGIRAFPMPDAEFFSGLARNVQRLFDLTGGTVSLWAMIGTSFAIATGVAVMTTVAAFLAAYAITFQERGVTRAVFWISLATLYFPIEARMLPTFDVAVKLGLVNSFAGLVLPILPLAAATFIFRQHMRSFPPELLEAARLDGVSVFGFLRDFVVPLSWGPILAVVLISFMLGWNQYLWPLMISTNDTYFPVVRGLNLAGTGSGPSMVLAAVSILPPILLVMFFLRALSRLTALRA